VLQFAPLDPAQILIAASSGGVLLVLFELIKRIRLPGEPRSI